MPASAKSGRETPKKSASGGTILAPLRANIVIRASAKGDIRATPIIRAPSVRNTAAITKTGSETKQIKSNSAESIPVFLSSQIAKDDIPERRIRNTAADITSEPILKLYHSW
jgi:hypothetical protein